MDNKFSFLNRNVHSFYKNNNLNKDIFGNRRVNFMAGSVGGSSQVYTPWGGAVQNTDKLTPQQRASGVTDTLTTTISSAAELQSLTKGRNAYLPPDVYAALARGEEVQVTLSQRPPERVNLFVPLFALASQMLMSGGAAYSETLGNAIQGVKKGSNGDLANTGTGLNAAAAFTSKYGSDYSLNPFGGASHIDIDAQYKILTRKQNEKSSPVIVDPLKRPNEESIGIDPLTHKPRETVPPPESTVISDPDTHKTGKTQEVTPPNIPSVTSETQAPKPLTSFEIKPVTTEIGDIVDKKEFRLMTTEGYKGKFDINIASQATGIPVEDLRRLINDSNLDTSGTNEKFAISFLNKYGDVVINDGVGAVLVKDEKGKSLERPIGNGNFNGNSAVITDMDSQASYAIFLKKDTGTFDRVGQARANAATDYIGAGLVSGAFDGGVGNFEPSTRHHDNPTAYAKKVSDAQAVLNKPEYKGKSVDELLAIAKNDPKKAPEIYSSLFLQAENNTHVENGMYGAGHIGKMQEAMVDRANVFVDGARAINNVYNNKPLDAEEKKGLGDLVALYNNNPANSPKISIDPENPKISDEDALKLLNFAENGLDNIKSKLEGGFKDAHVNLAVLNLQIPDIRSGIEGLKSKIQGPAEGTLPKTVEKYNEVTVKYNEILDAVKNGKDSLPDGRKVSDAIATLKKDVESLGTDVQKFTNKDGNPLSSVANLIGNKSIENLNKKIGELEAFASGKPANEEKVKQLNNIIAQLDKGEPLTDDQKKFINDNKDFIATTKSSDPKVKVTAESILSANTKLEEGVTQVALSKKEKAAEYNTLIGGREYLEPFAKKLPKEIQDGLKTPNGDWDHKKIANFVQKGSVDVKDKEGNISTLSMPPELSEDVNKLKDLNSKYQIFNSKETEGLQVQLQYEKIDALIGKNSAGNDFMTDAQVKAATGGKSKAEIKAMIDSGDNVGLSSLLNKVNDNVVMSNPNRHNQAIFQRIDSTGVGFSADQQVKENSQFVSSTRINKDNITNSPGAKKQLDDFLSMAVKGDVISQTEYNDAKNNPEKMVALFAKVEKDLGIRYDMKIDTFLGAEHITDLQRRLVEKSQNLNDGAYAAQKFSSGKPLSEKEQKSLNALLNDYNKNISSPQKPLSLEDLKNKDNLVSVLEHGSKQLTDISQSVKNTGFFEHGQLKELVNDANNAVTGGGKPNTGINSLINYVKNPPVSKADADSDKAFELSKHASSLAKIYNNNGESLIKDGKLNKTTGLMEGGTLSEDAMKLKTYLNGLTNPNTNPAVNYNLSDEDMIKMIREYGSIEASGSVVDNSQVKLSAEKPEGKSKIDKFNELNSRYNEIKAKPLNQNSAMEMDKLQEELNAFSTDISNTTDLSETEKDNFNKAISKLENKIQPSIGAFNKAITSIKEELNDIVANSNDTELKTQIQDILDKPGEGNDLIELEKLSNGSQASSNKDYVKNVYTTLKNLNDKIENGELGLNQLITVDGKEITVKDHIKALESDFSKFLTESKSIRGISKEDLSIINDLFISVNKVVGNLGEDINSVTTDIINGIKKADQVIGKSPVDAALLDVKQSKTKEELDQNISRLIDELSKSAQTNKGSAVANFQRADKMINEARVQLGLSPNTENALFYAYDAASKGSEIKIDKGTVAYTKPKDDFDKKNDFAKLLQNNLQVVKRDIGGSDVSFSPLDGVIGDFNFKKMDPFGNQTMMA